MMKRNHCDLLLRGARVIDPATGRDAVEDVAVSRGIIQAMGSELDMAADGELDMRGKVVTPGLVDLHCHVYPDAHWGLDPDTAGVHSGVTTVFDGGSAGLMTFNHFRNTYVTRARTDVYAFLHLHPTGEAILPEIWDREKLTLHPDSVVRVIEENRDLIKGIKVRGIGPWLVHQGLEGLEFARDICSRTGLPLMTHIGLDPGDAVPEADLDAFMRGFLGMLESGDIITHAFTGKRGRLFRDDGLYDEDVRSAIARGVVLDACVGRTNFSWDAVHTARAHGFSPDVISTDLTTFGMEAVSKNMGVVMSKFLAVGFSLQEVVAMATTAPARAMGLYPAKGALAVGGKADMSILDVFSGEYSFMDRNKGELLRGDKLIAPWGVYLNGELVKAKHTGQPTM